MQYFEKEIRINIFKYVDYPLNLALNRQNWSVIAKNPYAKIVWLIAHYGKAHALLHAIRLGPTFINIPVYQALIARNVIISRYFIQRLLMYFGKYDQKLIELKIEHQFDADKIRTFQQKIKSPWTSNLPILFNCHLSNAGKNLLPKGNSMRLFSFHSIGSHIIKYAPDTLKMNLKDIEDVVLNKWFAQFPFKPKPDLKGDSYTHQPIPEVCSPDSVIKSFDFMQQGNFLSSLTVMTLFTNNVGERPSRNVNRRRRRLRRQRNANRIYRRCVQFNNQDTLNRIANLPQQQITNDPLVNQFFNGSSFV